jgi:hypothetical protein
MPNPLYIDNIDVYSAYGVYVMEDGPNGLAGMPSFKKVTSTDWHEQSGVDADLKDLVLGGRQFSVAFHSSHRIPSATAQRFVEVYLNECGGTDGYFTMSFLVVTPVGVEMRRR